LSPENQQIIRKKKGGRKITVHKTCPQIQTQPVGTIQSNHIQKASVTQPAYRLFIYGQVIDRLPYLMQHGLFSVSVDLRFCLSDLPERDPEAFNGWVEVNLSGKC
jgi:hypothetical protein